MGLFSRDRFVLINIETKDIVWEGKEFVTKETVLKDIEKENLPDVLYRLEVWNSGRKVRNEWVMRKPKKKPTPEELAAKGREEAEQFMLTDALDIKDRVEKHNAFKAKVRELYGIEGVGGVDKIQIPTGKDGKLGIIEAAQIAVAESTYEGIRKTRPEEVAASFKSVMDSGTTILAGVAQMLTERITESKKRPRKKEEPEKKKKEPEKKTEPKSEEKKEEVEIHKEDIGEGIIKTTFGSDGSTDSTARFQKVDNTSSDAPVGDDVYEDYEKYMTGVGKEEEAVEVAEKE